MFTVVVGAVCRSLNNFHFPESEASLKRPEYKSCDPEVSYSPYTPISTASELLLLSANNIKPSPVVIVKRLSPTTALAGL